jgi:hypothetical protein
VSVRRTDQGTVVLEGLCPVEDAEALLQILQATPAAPIDWTRCRQLHTAVFQVIIAAGSHPVGRCGDPWAQQWLAPTSPPTGTDD